MTTFERTLDRWLPRIMTAFMSILVMMAIGVFLWMNRGAFTTANDVVVANPAAAVRDARALIASRTGHMIATAELPPSLRIEGLRWANVHDGHIDLVFARTPDVSRGARIWLPHQRPHHDQRTRSPDIYFYRYTPDPPVSTDTLP